MKLLQEIMGYIKNKDTDGFIELADKNPEVLVVTDRDGNSPLHYACALQADEIALFLVKEGLDLNVKGSGNLTAFELYINNCFTKDGKNSGLVRYKFDVVKTFLKYGAFVNNDTIKDFRRLQRIHPGSQTSYKPMLDLLAKTARTQNDRNWKKPKRPNPRPPKM